MYTGFDALSEDDREALIGMTLSDAKEAFPTHHFKIVIRDGYDVEEAYQSDLIPGQVRVELVDDLITGIVGYG